MQYIGECERLIKKDLVNIEDMSRTNILIKPPDTTSIKKDTNSTILIFHLLKNYAILIPDSEKLERPCLHWEIQYQVKRN